MKKFDVSVIKTVCATVSTEAESAEEAERKVREQFAASGLRGLTWIDYEPHEKDLNRFDVTWVEERR